MGGVKDRKESASMTVLSADRSKWIELKLKLPYNAVNSGAVRLNGEIYLVGGMGNPKALYKLDKNMKWIRLADMNVGRGYIASNCFVIDGDIWVFGGHGRDNDDLLNSVEKYDLVEDLWMNMPYVYNILTFQ